MLRAILEDACSLVSLLLFGACLLIWAAIISELMKSSPYHAMPHPATADHAMPLPTNP